MFKRVVSILNRLVACLFTAPSLVTAETHNNTANHSPAQSGQPCKAAQTPAKLKRKPKSKVAQPITQVKSQKAAPKPAQTTSGSRGRPRKTPALPTQSPAPTQPKQKTEAVPSIKAVSKPGKKKSTAPAVTTASQSKATGSKSETPVRRTRQHAK